MNFFKERIKRYNEKKLQDAIREMNFHIGIKKELESQLEEITDDAFKHDLEKKITNQTKLIKAWDKNIDKINDQLKKLEKNK